MALRQAIYLIYLRIMNSHHVSACVSVTFKLPCTWTCFIRFVFELYFTVTSIRWHLIWLDFDSMRELVLLIIWIFQLKLLPVIRLNVLHFVIKSLMWCFSKRPMNYVNVHWNCDHFAVSSQMYTPKDCQLNCAFTRHNLVSICNACLTCLTRFHRTYLSQGQSSEIQYQSRKRLRYSDVLFRTKVFASLSINLSPKQIVDYDKTI